jgi:hypothetical protein
MVDSCIDLSSSMIVNFGYIILALFIKIKVVRIKQRLGMLPF